MTITSLELDGEFLHAEHSEYEASRVIENMRLARMPVAIARCASVSDVQAALAYARDEGLAIAVRSGGHSAAGWSSIDGGLIIDLTLMRSVAIDREARTARIAGGALASDLVSAAFAHGLAPVTGVHSTVGLAGLLLGIGEGYLTGRRGFGVDNLIEVEIVIAGGELLTLSADSNPDLFWAVRGAGANFGVVTAMTVLLHPAPTSTIGGTIAYRGDDRDAAADYVWELMHTASLDSWPSACFSLDHGTPKVAVTVGHVGDREEGLAEVERLRSVGTPASDTTAEMSYPELVDGGGSVKENTLRPRAVWAVYRFAFDGDIAAQKALVREQQSLLLDSPATYISIWRTPVLDNGAHESAAPRNPGLSVFVRSMWDDAADDELNLAWFARTTAAFEASGLVSPAANTVNHVSQLSNSELRALHGEVDYARLAELKRRYDPENVFASNANIPPA